MARKGGVDGLDLFAWADRQPEPTSPTPAPAIAPEPDRPAAVIIDRVAFFRQRKKFFLAIFYQDENALIRPVSGEVIDFDAFKQRRAEQSVATAPEGRATA